MDGHITQATLGTRHRTKNDNKNTIHKGWTRYFQRICSPCFCKTIISFCLIIIKWQKCILNTSLLYIYSPRKVKHHLICFNNIFSNNELISNRFAVFVSYSYTLTYLWNRLLIDFYLCVYDRVCKVSRVLFNICVCERNLIFCV